VSNHVVSLGGGLLSGSGRDERRGVVELGEAGEGPDMALDAEGGRPYVILQIKEFTTERMIAA
jgi:hypothetical protein